MATQSTASTSNLQVARLPRGVPVGGADLALISKAQAVYSDQAARLFASRDLELTVNNHVQFQSQNTSENVLTFQQATATGGGPYVPTVVTDAINAQDLAERADPTSKYDAGFFKQTAKFGLDVLTSRLSAGENALLPLAPTSSLQGGIPIAAGSGILHFDAPRSVMGVYHLEKIDTLADRLHIVGSVRVDRFTDARDLYSAQGLTSERASQVGLSWLAGGAFDVFPWMTAYGNRANGFVGQTAITDPSSKPAPAQGRDASEVGLRNFFFDKRLSLTTSFFTLEQTDVAIANAADASGLTSVVVPGQATRGVEFEAQGEIVDGLNLILAFADVHTAFRNLSGSSLMQAAPQLTGSVWTTYAIKSGPLAGIVLGAGAHGNSASQTGVALSMGGTGAIARIPGYVVEDAMIGYEHDDYSIALKLNNLTNHYFLNPTVVSNQIAIGEGRNFQLVARKSF